MYRRFSVLALGILLASFLPTVQDAQAQFRVGLAGGANFMSLADATAGSSAINFASSTGFHGGLFVDFQLGPISLVPGAYYLNAGALFEGAPFLEDSSFDLEYVSLVLDVKYTLTPGPIKPFVFIGPEFRQLFSANEGITDLEENLSEFMLNVTGGVGVEFAIGEQGAVVFPYIRFIKGLEGLTDKDYGVGSILITTEGGAEDVWLIGVGVRF